MPPSFDGDAETTGAADAVLPAIVTIALKATAYLLTGSVGLLSDALESLVDLAGPLMALAMLTVAARQADGDHPYGHDKAAPRSSPPS